MKTNYFMAVALFFSISASAQLDFTTLQPEIAFNYTLYAGEFRKVSPAIKVGATVLVGEENNRVGLYYTHAFPIKDPGFVPLNPSGSVKTEYTYNFKTLSLDYTKFFGTGDKALSAYGKAGAGIVFVDYKERLVQAIPPGNVLANSQLDKDFVITPIFFGLLGTQFSMGKPKVFCEILLGGPATQANNRNVENLMPIHFGINAGIRFAINNIVADEE